MRSIEPLKRAFRALFERIKAGELDGYRLGHKIVVSDSSLRAFLQPPYELGTRNTGRSMKPEKPTKPEGNHES